MLLSEELKRQADAICNLRSERRQKKVTELSDILIHHATASLRSAADQGEYHATAAVILSSGEDEEIYFAALKQAGDHFAKDPGLEVTRKVFGGGKFTLTISIKTEANQGVPREESITSVIIESPTDG